MFSLVHPAICTRLLERSTQLHGLNLHVLTQGLQSGVEDLPDAFRSIPVAEEYIPFMLFGLSSAVLPLIRWCAFLEAMCGRVAARALGMYVGDGCLIDLVEAESIEHDLLRCLFTQFDTPTAPRKKQPMAP